MTKSLLWLSDTHLNVLPADQYQKFITAVLSKPCDGIIVTGDIAEPPITEKFLDLLATSLSCPIYFVLGNHDYYGTEVMTQRLLIEQKCHSYQQLYFLTRHQPIKLAPHCMLVGIDSWADGRSSDFMQCPRELFDKHYIKDLMLTKDSKVALLTQLQQLADMDVRTLAEKLTAVMKSKITRLLIITHVPPWHKTVALALSPRDQAELSHFTCLALGNLLHDFSLHQPQLQIVHIAGHVHRQSFYKIAPNYQVITASATVGKPRYQYLELEKLFSV